VVEDQHKDRRCCSRRPGDGLQAWLLSEDGTPQTCPVLNESDCGVLISTHDPGRFATHVDVAFSRTRDPARSYFRWRRMRVVRRSRNALALAFTSLY
jgi:hypothetical protein